jgi:Zn-dependent protease with chaperone function
VYRPSNAGKIRKSGGCAIKGKLVFASIFTLGILACFVFTIVAAAAYAGGLINATVMVTFTILISAVMWLISPWLTDLIQGWVYKIESIEFEQFASRYPECARFLKTVCEKHGLKIPMLRLMHDLNPTAYCYGSYPGNARLVMSDGIFHYLNSEEASSVIAHEIGHIINKDFIVMTVAATLLQILYELYVIFTRVKGRKNPLPLIGLVAYIFWLIGTYLLLYLSRTREYLADRFSAEATQNPNWLSSALVKIAYGIADQPDTEGSRRLLVSTRAMGIYDFKAAQTTGTAFKMFLTTNTTTRAEGPGNNDSYAYQRLVADQASGDVINLGALLPESDDMLV